MSARLTIRKCTREDCTNVQFDEDECMACGSKTEAWTVVRVDEGKDLKFDPVFLPAHRALENKVSVTMGKHENSCSRAGFLYAKHKGTARSHPMERGSALHRVLELATKATIAEGEPLIPGELVKAICGEVIDDPAYRTPVEEHDYLRESAYRWAGGFACDPSSIVAVENLFVLDLGGVTLRGKIDYAETFDGGLTLKIDDYKSARSMPTQEDISRKRPDGTVAAKAYQLVCYGLLAAFGVPVREEICPECFGSGVEKYDAGLPEPCSFCKGRPRREIPEPFGIASQATEFDVGYVFPGINAGDVPGERRATLTRLELQEYRESIENQMHRIMLAEKSGDWPATPGSHCGECPARKECPIPVELNDFAGRINTVEEARQAAVVLDREKADHAARRKELKLFVESLPDQRLPFGKDKVWEFGYRESIEITDKEAMFAAMTEAVQFGTPFDRAKFERVKKSTPFLDRTLTVEELDA